MFVSLCEEFMDRTPVVFSSVSIASILRVRAFIFSNSKSGFYVVGLAGSLLLSLACLQSDQLQLKCPFAVAITDLACLLIPMHSE